MAFNSPSMTSDGIQKCLDENQQLILAILENQDLGKTAECSLYQVRLQSNLLFLAALADNQTQGGQRAGSSSASTQIPGLTLQGMHPQQRMTGGNVPIQPVQIANMNPNAMAQQNQLRGPSGSFPAAIPQNFAPQNFPQNFPQPSFPPRQSTPNAFIGNNQQVPVQPQRQTSMIPQQTASLSQQQAAIASQQQAIVSQQQRQLQALMLQQRQQQQKTGAVSFQNTNFPQQQLPPQMHQIKHAQGMQPPVQNIQQGMQQNVAPGMQQGIQPSNAQFANGQYQKMYAPNQPPAIPKGPATSRAPQPMSHPAQPVTQIPPQQIFVQQRQGPYDFAAGHAFPGSGGQPFPQQQPPQGAPGQWPFTGTPPNTASHGTFSPPQTINLTEENFIDPSLFSTDPQSLNTNT